jgi:site-specific DNA recombinase
MERLLTAYQESLITLEELRSRAPELRKQQQAIEAELQSLEMAAVDQTRHLRLVETLAELRTRLRARANALAEAERQRVVRLLVHEILVGRDSITIRHSIPMPTLTPNSNDGARPTHGPPKSNHGPSFALTQSTHLGQCFRATRQRPGTAHRFPGRAPAASNPRGCPVKTEKAIVDPRVSEFSLSAICFISLNDEATTTSC